MSRFLKKCGILLLMLFVIVMIGAYGMYTWMCTHPNPYTIYSHEVNLRNSLEKLEQKDEPTIVIVAGSGCGFGLYSQLLKEHFNMPVINTGTHAGIGLKLQLALVRPYIHEGDILIVIPEYEQFDHLFYGDETAWRIMTATLIDKMENISLLQYLYLSKYIVTAFKEALEAWQYPPFTEQESESTSPYSINSLNEYGDVTFYEYRRHKEDIGMNKMKNNVIFQPAIDYLVETKIYVENRKAQMLFFPPAFHEKSFEYNREFIFLLNDKLTKNGIPYVCSPSRYEFPDSLFYDTSYHLTYDGCVQRTQMIINDIDSILLHNYNR